MECGGYTINSPTKEESVSSTNFFHSSIQPSIPLHGVYRLRVCRAAVLGEREPQSWYLVYLGTRPDARGKGYARKLVEHITAQVSPFPRKPCLPKKKG